MPSPFVHLHIAEQVKAAANGRLHQTLAAAWPAFYLGTIAPDYPFVTEASRASSHFYDLPPAPDNLGYNRMLASHPSLADPAGLPADQALFVAAYCAHLMLDLIWLREIVFPYFVQQPQLGDRRTRERLHFVLLTVLDQKALAQLPSTAVTTLSAATPNHWLPFAGDADLIAWRNMVATQLTPNGEIATVKIFAGRLGINPAEFAACLQEEWLAANLYPGVPVALIESRLKTAVVDTIDLVQRYLQGHL